MNMYQMLLLSRRVSLRTYRNQCSKIDLYKNFASAISAASDSDVTLRDNESKTAKKTAFPHSESDTFGSLRESIENTMKTKRNLISKTKQNEKNKIFKIKLPQKDESDVFGNLSEKSPMWYPDMYEESKEDNDQDDDSVIVKNLHKNKRCPKEYLKEMKRLVNQKKIKEALELFVDMRRNFVTPSHVNYTYMIGVCGKIGYTEMAFKLLRQMTDRSYQPTPATLTGLFNSCAESPYPEYGLKKARLLKEKIETKSWLLNQITYHAMIKAFGRCGDLKTAFEIVDDMAKADVKIDASTYSFLLMSCIANKESGFTYAVEVWRKMKSKKCLPTIFICNLLLRTARDCDIGPTEISSLLLQHWSSYSKRPYGFITKDSISKETILKLNSGQDIDTIKCSKNIPDDKCATEHTNSGKPNDASSEELKYELQEVIKTAITPKSPMTTATSLLSARPQNGPEILELVNIKDASDRLSLIGGVEGFLEFMSSAKIKPDIKTFTLLLECLPPDIKEEEKLLSLLESHHVKPDVDFFNILIKRKNFRKETAAAKSVLVLINKYELQPNIMTFGVLALGCRNLQQAATFISEMEKFGASLNIEIAGSMLRNSSVALDFAYMKYVLKIMEKQKIKPNEKVLLSMEKTLSDVKKNIILMEQGKEVDSFYHRENLQVDFKEFSNYYREWLKRMEFEPETHLWLQYKTDIIDRTKEEKPRWEIERSS